jgi:hypothetical protein
MTIFSKYTNGAQHCLTSLSISNSYSSVEADFLQVLLNCGPVFANVGFQVTRRGMTTLLVAAYTNFNVQTVWGGSDFDEVAQLSHAVEERRRRRSYKNDV